MLRMVFKICKGLGIDDPCYWMNTVSPVIIDQWIAFELSEMEEQQSEMVSPEVALARLNENAKNNHNRKASL